MPAHVDAYDHAARRQATALLRALESGPDPRRRLWRAALTGGLVSGLLIAANAVTGLGGTTPAAPLPRDGVVIDAATGGAYVMISHLLHPALNLASAQLVAGPHVAVVAPGRLDAVPHGPPVGIPGAPEALPAPARLDRGPWSACTTAGRAGVDVEVGSRGTAPAGPTIALQDVADPASVWLVERGTRFAVTAAARTLLGLDAPVPVPRAMLVVLPEGPPLGVPTLPHAGAPAGHGLPRAVRVGDLVRVVDTDEVYVAAVGGLAPVDVVARDLLAGAATATHLVAARQVATVASVPRPAAIPSAWPRTLPAAGSVGATATVCVGYRPGPDRQQGRWSATARPTQAAPARPATVSTRPGGGQLVRISTGPGRDGYALVAESLRFALPTDAAVRRLGYEPAHAVPVPEALLALVPAGPELDPAGAARVYRGPPRGH